MVTQVGYHNRFVGTFREVKALLDAGAIGTVSNILGEAYGPVVLRRKGSTWRSRKEEGGGSLYDYAAHPINLLNWYLGEPIGVGGTILNSIFSREIDDEVFSTLFYPDGNARPGRGQLVGRVVPEDDHADHRLGDRRADLRRPPGVPGLPAGHRPDPRRLRARAGTCATRPSSPSRSASTCAARSTAPRSITSSSGSATGRVEGLNGFESAPSPTA